MGSGDQLQCDVPLLCPLSLPQLPAVAFSVSSLPFTEPMLAVWAQLVSLAGSRLEKQPVKKVLKQGSAGEQGSLLPGCGPVPHH